MSKLLTFRSDVKSKTYTRCKRQIIIGSDTCMACKYKKDITKWTVAERGSDGKVVKFYTEGICECSYE